jgi:O-antigen/teichoic acid export membrane protein
LNFTKAKTDLAANTSSLSDRAGLLIVANLVKFSVGFIMPMVLVRLLSQNDYGTYQQMVLVSNTAIGLMTLGLPTSVYYFVHHVEKQRIPTLVVQTTLLLFISGAFATAVIFFGAPLIAKSLNNPEMAGLLSIYSLSILFLIASEHSIAFLIAQDRYRLAVWFEVGETIIRVALLLLPLWFGFGFSGLVVAIVIYAVLRFAVRTFVMFRTGSFHFGGWSKSTFAREQLGYSMPITISSLAGLLGGTFNRGIVAAAFTPAHYALYAVGNLPFPFASIFQASVGNVLRASLPPLVRDGNLKEVVRIMREGSRKLAIIVLPSFIFLYGFSQEFITLLFTNRYEESVPIFRIYLWEVPLHLLLLSPIPQIFGKTKVNLYITLCSTVSLILLSYLLLKGVGFYGPAIASVTSQYFAVVIYIVVVLRLTKSRLLELLPVPEMFRIVVASGVALVAARLVKMPITSSLWNLVIAGVVFSVIFLVVAALIKVFTEADVKLARRWGGKLIPALKGG